MTEPSIPYFLASEDTFFNDFDPVPVDADSGDYQRDFEAVKDVDEHLVWTVIEGEDSSNSLWVAPGFHHVNRVAYVLAGKPWVEGQSELLWMEGLDFALDQLDQYEAGDEEWDEAREVVRDRVSAIREHVSIQLCDGKAELVDAWLEANPDDPIAKKVAELQPVLDEADSLSPLDDESPSFAP